MQRLLVLLAVVMLAAVAFIANTCSPPVPNEPFTIVWNYDTSGYLETCGCSAHQLGGLARRVHQIDKLREQQPLLALEGAHIVADAGEFQLFKAEAAVNILNMAHYDAMQLGVREAQHGAEGIDRLTELAEFPCFSANLEVGGQPWPTPSVTVQIAGADVAITGVSQPAAVTFELEEGTGFSDPQAALDSLLPRLRQDADITILCLEGERTWIRDMVARYESNADLFLAGCRNKAVANWDFTSEPPALNNWDLGRYLGIINIDPAPDGFTVAGTSLALKDELPEAERVVGYLSSRYRPQLKEKFFSTMKTDLEQLYLPPESCWGCHEVEYEAYAASRHSHALETLEEKNQLYNPDCMPCHVVYDPNMDELQAMNCVICHINIDEAHLWDAPKGTTAPPDPPVVSHTYEYCVRCHDELNSTPFADEWPQYVMQIYHGGDMSAAEAAAEEMGIDINEPPTGHE